MMRKRLKELKRGIGNEVAQMQDKVRVQLYQMIIVWGECVGQNVVDGCVASLMGDAWDCGWVQGRHPVRL